MNKLLEGIMVQKENKVSFPRALFFSSSTLLLFHVFNTYSVRNVQTIIFVETKRKVDELTRRLRRDG